MLKSAAVSLIGGLLLRLLIPQQLPPLISEKPPVFEQIPPDHYLGISHGCSEQAEAFESALQNAVKQIILRIGAEYQLEFERIVYSEDDISNTTVKDSLSFEGRVAFGDLEVKSWYLQNAKKNYTGYVLVYFPQADLIKARQFIENENSRRLAQFNMFMVKAINEEAAGAVVDALEDYKKAVIQADTLFKERKINKAIAKTHIKSTLSRINLMAVSNYDQRYRHYVICKALYNNRPAQNIPIRFELLKGNGLITPLTYTDLSGTARCDISSNAERLCNEVKAFIDLEGVQAEHIFTFSTAEPRPIIVTSPLKVIEDCFVFEVRENNDVGATFTSYEVSIGATYRNASFINYYIARVDSSKSVSRSFNFMHPIEIPGRSYQVIKIPFNSWLKQKTNELNKWYMGSNIEYRLVLKGNEAEVATH